MKILLLSIVLFLQKNKIFLEKRKIFNIDITDTIEKDPNRNKGTNYKNNEIYLLCSKNKKKLFNIKYLF